MTQQETRGRKALPAEQKKPPQATLKINSIILPFVTQLKGNLKKGRVTPEILQSLFCALEGKELITDNEALKNKNLALKAEIKALNEKVEQLQNKTNRQRKASTVKALKKHCPFCNKDYETTNKRKKFCSDSCRKKSHAEGK